jgi:hypothetical protein
LNCEHKNMKAVKRSYDDGKNWSFGWQCENCGTWKAQALSKFSLSQKFELFDESIKENFLNKLREDWRQKKDQQDYEWQQKHEEHLQSEYWKKIRSLVLDRDRGICQGCLIAPAAHVHHLTYDRLGCEMAIDLVSLCVGCHDKIHGRPEVDLSCFLTEIPF